VGCNIHIVAQRRQADGTWHDIERETRLGFKNYDTFTALAGVRRTRADIPIIVEPRGWPEDVVRSERWRGWLENQQDSHTFSWLSLTEIYSYDWVGLNLVGYGYETPTFADVCHRSFDHFQDDENIRLIFCFDN
jgi:hypothetical protein